MRLESHVVHVVHGAGLGHVDPVVHWVSTHVLIDKIGPHPGIVEILLLSSSSEFIIVAVVSSIGIVREIGAHPERVHGIVALIGRKHWLVLIGGPESRIRIGVHVIVSSHVTSIGTIMVHLTPGPIEIFITGSHHGRSRRTTIAVIISGWRPIAH